jgi:hypothetical protein
LNIIEKFKSLPSRLEIGINNDHFQFLDRIIEKEVSEFSERTQHLFERLMLSFCSKKKRVMDEKEKKKIQDLFLNDAKYKENLTLLVRNIKEQFNAEN